jgi:hypothetical protein
VYKSSKSSSSLTIGINMHSGIKLNDSIIPLKICETKVKIKKKPTMLMEKWYLIVRFRNNSIKDLKLNLKLFLLKKSDRNILVKTITRKYNAS